MDAKARTVQGGCGMIETIALLAVVIWVACTEIRIQRLKFRNQFLTERIVEIDARVCILEKKEVTE